MTLQAGAHAWLPVRAATRAVRSTPKRRSPTTAPKAHSITGKGATFLFGGAGRLISTNASLRINRRVSDTYDPWQRDGGDPLGELRPRAAGVPQPVQIPNDAVLIADVYNAANPSAMHR